MRELELDPVRLDLRDEQQILDELVQPLGAAPDHVEVRAARVSPRLSSSSCIISRKPEIDVSGVRSSCETVATNASRMPVELAVGGHLAQRPDPAGEAAVASGTGAV